MSGLDTASMIEIIPNRLYWTTSTVSDSDVPKEDSESKSSHHHYFTIDNELMYEGFYMDFGPLDLSMVVKFCKKVEAKLNHPDYADKKIIHYCSNAPEMRANAACLMCLFSLIVEKKSALAAFEPFIGMEEPFQPFRDASSYEVCSYDLTIEDCLAGVEKATDLGWFDWKTFDVDEYERLKRHDTCGLNWIVPDKFMAFAGPISKEEDWYTPKHYVDLFQEVGIKLVVRLNDKQYNRRCFTDHGIGHRDIIFKDGSCPAPAIIKKFLVAAEAEPGAVAVHCMAGLGRTCTLIGLYAMKHFKFPARAFIGWNRMCRPGSVLGPQQEFLVRMEKTMFNYELQRKDSKESATVQRDDVADFDGAGDFDKSCHAADVAGVDYEDKGQGMRLCRAKGRHSVRSRIVSDGADVRYRVVSDGADSAGYTTTASCGPCSASELSASEHDQPEQVVLPTWPEHDKCHKLSAARSWKHQRPKRWQPKVL